MNENFILSTSFPSYLIKFVDKHKEKNRSEYISKIVSKNLPNVEDLLNEKEVKDISISLPFELIDELEKKARTYKTTMGRIILLALSIEFYKELTDGQNAEEKRLKS